ncbi:MAG: hypothetical protein A2745_02715 [Candidatus Harrisonbacteria bacterium RIFCSPHIGHO2_01_FULL_44_13]|uniref:Uncharacterized protein n=1 Tax=Candidatus Harrisonbacteria bacterium RIFCSPLOWO2_01_FULL_44_18 TaxID=1798407 RepID=A0A1G1ZQA3_9BACT|nr:MAG: hypothetical protein A2745_02715 [Candidatus Harrisonbacteria bacterium RIFCSPHIGHO2_01_FULL_44_13]OGY65997.1 MAG: hypothetical protein A3A16_01260 [Candidatus Harrisonbacteria bacterium RIFCSPLOWO2_01_FULL_44_18]
MNNCGARPAVYKSKLPRKNYNVKFFLRYFAPSPFRREHPGGTPARSFCYNRSLTKSGAPRAKKNRPPESVYSVSHRKGGGVLFKTWFGFQIGDDLI